MFCIYPRLSRCALLSETGDVWRISRGGHSITWQKNVKTLAGWVAYVGRVKLPSRGPRDPVPKRRSESVGDAAQLCSSSSWSFNTSFTIFLPLFLFRVDGVVKWQKKSNHVSAGLLVRKPVICTSFTRAKMSPMGKIVVTNWWEVE